MPGYCPASGQVYELGLGHGVKAGREAKRLGSGLDSNWPPNNKLGIIANGIKLLCFSFRLVIPQPQHRPIKSVLPQEISEPRRRAPYRLKSFRRQQVSPGTLAGTGQGRSYPRETRM